MQDKKTRVVGAQTVPTEFPHLSQLRAELEQTLIFASTSVDVFVDDDKPPESTPPIPDDSCSWGDCCLGWEGPVWCIVDWREIERVFAARVARVSYADNKRMTSVMATFRARGEYRKLATIRQDWRSRLCALERDFPNFGDVVDYLRGAYAMAEKEDGVPRLSPLLLDGPPGVGKSLFATAFAELLGSGMVTVHMEAAQTASALTGSEEHWGNTKPGQLFNILVEQDFANPVVFIDEIDKAADGEHDPLMGLFALLEPGTASRFADLSYPWVTLDASRVLWVCTSNDADTLPAPILDRLRCFAIAPPTEQQARRIVQKIYANIVVETPSAAAIRLSRSAVDALVTLSPRRIQHALREAIGRAMYDGRKRVLERDIPLEVDVGVDTKRIGFLP